MLIKCLSYKHVHLRTKVSQREDVDQVSIIQTHNYRLIHPIKTRYLIGLDFSHQMTNTFHHEPEFDVMV